MIKQFLIASANALLYATLSVSNAHADLIIDGILSEPSGLKRGYLQSLLQQNRSAVKLQKYLTEVRLFTNDKGIYVGFTNYQPSSVAKIDRRFARDARIEADRNVFGVDFDGMGLLPIYLQWAVVTQKEMGCVIATIFQVVGMASGIQVLPPRMIVGILSYIFLDCGTYVQSGR